MIDNGDIDSILISLESVIPFEKGIVNSDNPFVLYGVKQYTPYNLNFASNKSITVDLLLNDILTNSVYSTFGKVSSVVFNTNLYGDLKLSFVSNDYNRDIVIKSDKSDLNLNEITESLEFDFNASLRSNSDTNKDNWSYGEYSALMSGFKWNEQSGWSNGSLLLNENSSIQFNYSPLSTDSLSTGKTLEFEFSTINAENDNAIICDLRNENGVGLVITASEARLTSRIGNTVYTKFKVRERIRVSFVINKSSNVTNKGLVFIYINGVICGAVNYGNADNFVSDALMQFNGTEDVQIALYYIRVYNIALSNS
jgi:hypothetical protein